MNTTITWVLENWLTGWMGLFLYWLPLSLCVVGYTIRTFENFHKDIEARERYLNYLNAKKNEEPFVNANSYYTPTDTIGTLIGRALVSLMPVANLWAGIFDVSPRMFSRLISLVEKTFNIPLVPEPQL